METDSTGQAELHFDIFRPEVTSNPYSFYSQFRNSDPVYKTPLGPWFLTRHDDVSFVIRDQRFGRDFDRTQVAYYGPEWIKERSLSMLAKMILYLDPPEHGRIRSLMTQAFSAKRIEAMRSRIQAVANQLIDKVEHLGEMDIVQDFAFPLPISVTCEMLGIPKEDLPVFIRSFRITSKLAEAVPMNREELDVANDHLSFLEDYFVRLFELRRQEPQDDLITSLIAKGAKNEQLSNQELIANIILLFIAGYETTSNMIGNSLLVLHQNLEEYSKIKDNSSILASSIDELLRYESPVQLTARQVLTDVDLNGKRLHKGDLVLACLGAANHDPDAYANPDLLNFERKNIRHFSFGGGIHFCLGAQLARIQLEVSIETFLRRLPNLYIEDTLNPKWRPTFLWRGLQSLRATWHEVDR